MRDVLRIILYFLYYISLSFNILFLIVAIYEQLYDFFGFPNPIALLNKIGINLSYNLLFTFGMVSIFVVVGLKLIIEKYF